MLVMKDRSALVRGHFIAICLAQILFAALLWPLLSGESVYSSRMILYSGSFAPSLESLPPVAPGDDVFQDDFGDQERLFLRFYRESFRSGELPFWNEQIFGGLSQEDSLAYSYLSPFNIPWLLIGNDHIAKAVQIYLLLNFGLFGLLWWARILRVAPAWFFLSAMLLLLSPMSLHFQGHQHQPALYFSALYIAASVHLFLRGGATRHLAWSAFIFTVAIWCNFITLLLFICILIAFLMAGNVAWPAEGGARPAVLRRAVALAGALFGIVLSCSFLLGPIALEAHLVREPVSLYQANQSPLASPSQFVRSLLFHEKAPLQVAWLLVLGAFAVMLKERHTGELKSLYPLGLFLGFALLLGSSSWVQDLYRAVVPSAKYSGNIYFRLLFMANVLIAPLFAWCGTRLGGGSRAYRQVFLAICAAVVMVNLLFWLIAAAPGGFGFNPDDAFGGKLGRLAERLAERPVIGLTAGAGTIFAAVLFGLAVSGARRRATGWGQWVSLAMAGAMLVAMYRLSDGPSLSMAQDAESYPIFRLVEEGRGAPVLTLEDCSGDVRHYTRREPVLAGFRPLDAPTDTGLFRRTREFWMPLNDAREHYRKGLFYYELNWVCREMVSSREGGLMPGFGRLLKALGVRYLFATADITDSMLERLGREGEMRAYRVAVAWPDMVFLPGVREAEWTGVMAGLVRNDADAIEAFDRIEAGKAIVASTRMSNLRWEGTIPPVASAASGVLFMNHPIEYHRDLKFPLLDLPLEGYWEVRTADGAAPFPQTPVPYRSAEIRATDRVEVTYSLAHYRGWFALSLLGLAITLSIIRYWLRSWPGRCD
ncbi:MAG: hypothetical protein OHM77_10435 [Candidatus Nitricoxidivorans perseverans]|uniref:Uncharacterized protein n=1 Tax=Candidatus Nitricoxidivorans perseverans TaxID=2975601 RepID=A0AA49FK92_9PROT|nr:MAG: hypothetical protein OHM77_10435 [Candidatus Nitricoxidivorans perseverans]